jgi:hypothetical protein
MRAINMPAAASAVHSEASAHRVIEEFYTLSLRAKQIGEQLNKQATDGDDDVASAFGLKGLDLKDLHSGRMQELMEQIPTLWAAEFSPPSSSVSAPAGQIASERSTPPPQASRSPPRRSASQPLLGPNKPKGKLAPNEMSPHRVQNKPEEYNPQNPLLHCNRILKHFGGRVGLLPNEGFRDCGQFSASWSMAQVHQPSHSFLDRLAPYARQPGPGSYSENQFKRKKMPDLYRAPTQVRYALQKTARVGKSTLSDAPPPGTYAEQRDVFTQYPAFVVKEKV